MKKLILSLLFLICSLSFAETSKDVQIKNISDIKTLDLIVQEKTFLNKKSDEKVYNIKYVIPNMMRKEMLEPQSHKGEIFVYVDDTKKSYLPIFEQVLEDEAQPEENLIIDTIVLLQNKDRKDEKFRKLYNSGKLVRIRNDNITIEPKKTELIDGYYIPVSMKILDGDTVVAELTLKDVKINQKIDRKEFEL